MSKSYESAYNKWLFSVLQEYGFIDKDQALNSGAFATGASQLTLKRYLLKLTSQLGKLKFIFGEHNYLVT